MKLAKEAAVLIGIDDFQCVVKGVMDRIRFVEVPT